MGIVKYCRETKIQQVLGACRTGLGCETWIVRSNGSEQHFDGYPTMTDNEAVYWRWLSADSIERRIVAAPIGVSAVDLAASATDSDLIIQPVVKARASGAILVRSEEEWIIEFLLGLPAMLLHRGRVAWRILRSNGMDTMEQYPVRRGFFIEGGRIAERDLRPDDLCVDEQSTAMLVSLASSLSPGLYEFAWDGVGDPTILEKKEVVENPSLKPRLSVAIPYPDLGLTPEHEDAIHLDVKAGAFLSHLCSYSWAGHDVVEINGRSTMPSRIFDENQRC